MAISILVITMTESRVILSFLLKKYVFYNSMLFSTMQNRMTNFEVQSSRFRQTREMRQELCTHLKFCNSSLVFCGESVSGHQLVLKVTLQFLESCVEDVCILDGPLIQDL